MPSPQFAVSSLNAVESLALDSSMDQNGHQCLIIKKNATLQLGFGIV